VGWVRAVAYSSSANLGPGFDALAVALNAFHDVVEARLEYDWSGVIVERVEGEYAGGVPREGNTAAVAVERLLEASGASRVGVVLRISKGIPPGRGLGSSGASAAAAVLAASKLLGLRTGAEDLVAAAGAGEAASAGSPHYDNVAASLLGGLAIVATVNGALVVRSISVNAVFVVGVPETRVSPSKTRLMRSVLPQRVELSRAVVNWQRVAMLVTAFSRGELELAGKLMMGDTIVEPARARYVPCYSRVKEYSLEAGAYGFTISGAGPSVIALVPPDKSNEVASAMREAYSECGVEAMVRVARVAGPARVLG
jgi:homoserine kinase